MMSSDYFIDRSDSSSFGEVGFWIIPLLIMAVAYAAVGVAIGAVLGIGIALIFDSRPKSEAAAPVGFDGTLHPRVKKWAMWGAIVFAALAVVANTYQLIWPLPELVDRGVESLAPVPRFLSYAIQYAKSIVVDGIIGAVLGGGAATIAGSFRGTSSAPPR